MYIRNAAITYLPGVLCLECLWKGSFGSLDWSPNPHFWSQKFQIWGIEDMGKAQDTVFNPDPKQDPTAGGHWIQPCTPQCPWPLGSAPPWPSSSSSSQYISVEPRMDSEQGGQHCARTQNPWVPRGPGHGPPSLSILLITLLLALSPSIPSSYLVFLTALTIQQNYLVI